MKRKITLFSLFFLFSIGSKAQLDYSPLAPYVSSGILFEHNPAHPTVVSTLHNPLNFDGISDSIPCTRNIFESLNRFFFRASFDTDNTFLLLSQTLSNVINQSQNEEYISLGVMHFPYQYIDSGAFNEGYLTIDSTTQQVYANIGWTHIEDTLMIVDTTVIPYDTIYMPVDTSYYVDSADVSNYAFKNKQIFAAAVLKDIIILDTLPQSLNIRLIGSAHLSYLGVPPPYNIRVNGGPWQTIVSNQTISISNYVIGKNTIAVNHGFQGEGLISTTEVYVFHNEHKADYQKELFSDIDCPIDTSAGLGTGVVSFHINPVNGTLTKPVVIVEGLEIAHDFVSSDESAEMDMGFGDVSLNNRGYGEITYRAFASGAFKSQSLAHSLHNGPILIEELKNEGYDVVFVDFESNRADIRQNANYLMLLLQHLNEELLVNESNEQLVVLGLGTGAITARIALREMELQKCCHNTRLYASLDGPHRGLNIPLGIQAFNEEIGSGSGYTSFIEGSFEIRHLRKMLQTTVFDQLNVYHYDQSKNSIRSDFQQYLDQIGQPVQTHNIAISNGGDNGMASRQRDNLGDFFMVPDSAYFLLNPKTYLPSSQGIVYIGVMQGLINNGFPKNFNMAYLKPRVLQENTTPENQTILERGLSPNTNIVLRDLHWFIWGAGVAALYISNITHAKALSTALIAAATGYCLVCPPLVIKSDELSKMTISAAFTLLLEANIDYNKNRHPQDSRAIKNPYPTLSHDIAPGGRLNLPEAMEIFSNEAIKAYYNNHSFVSTLSALGVDDENLLLDIAANGQQFINNGTIPFDDYYAVPNGYPATNQSHAYLSEDIMGEIQGNITWFIEQVVYTDNPLNIPGNPQTSITIDGGTGYLNYGREIDKLSPMKHLYSMNIESDGEVHINKWGVLGFSSQPIGMIGNNSERFSISTLPVLCQEAECRIFDEGLFTIGDMSQGASNEGEVIFSEGSLLEIMSGGKLVIENNSHLIIEEGATLIIHPGAIIELNGGDAVLEIQGKVVLHDNVTFTFTASDPINHGYILLSQKTRDDQGNPIPLSEFWDIGNNAQIVLEGQYAQAAKILEVKNNPVIPADINVFKLNKGVIELHEGTTLDIFSEVDIQDCKFTSSEGLYNSVILNGNPNSIVRRNTFEKGTTGLRVTGTSAGSGLHVHNCDFINCQTGVYSENKSLLFFNSNFTNNSSVGWNAANMKGESVASNCTFANSPNGIIFHGQSGSLLSISGSDIMSTGTGVLMHEANLRFNCSNLQGNGKAVELDYVHALSSFGTSFLYNDIGVEFSELTRMNLADGSNIFMGNFGDDHVHMMGMFSEDAVTLGYLTLNIQDPNHPYYEQDVFRNRIELNVDPNDGVTLMMPIEMYDHLSEPVYFKNWDPFPPLLACSGPTPEYPPNFYSDSMIIMETDWTTNFEINGLQMPDFLLDVLDNIAPPGHGSYMDDVYALEMLGELFSEATYEAQGWDVDQEEDVAFLLEVAYRMGIRALNNAYQYEQLQPAGAQIQSPEYPVEIMLREADRRFLRIDGDPYDIHEPAHFENRLEKVHIYRLAEHYDQALNLLYHYENGSSYPNYDRWQYWICVSELEESLLLGNIDHYIFRDEILVCQSALPEFPKRYKKPNAVSGYPISKHGDYEVQVRLAPNPTTDLSQLELSSNEHGADVSVADMQGRILHQAVMAKGTRSLDLEAEKLKPGAYVVRVHFNKGDSKNIKWLVQD